MNPARTAILLTVVVAAQTAAANQPDDAGGVAYFEEHIRPLLIRHCYECHSEETENRSGGLVLDSQAGWEIGGDQGTSIVPGDVTHSLLLRAVRYDDPELRMPPGGPLSGDAVTRLEHWVKIGAPDPRTGNHPSADHAATRPSDPIAGRSHWAFRPLAKIEPPQVNDASWPITSIDRLILHRLEEAQLEPAPDASPEVLARRLSIQLTGLPPTPEQLRSFADNRRPDTVDRFVEQLLHSTQYGELWGRHWLDLARYADSNGLDENFLFREAWRYRNWVFEAFNRDVPFDRFLLEQIAGDLLPWETTAQRDQQRIATGFMVVGPKVLLGVQKDKQRMEVADEQIDTIGRTVLAQTLGCARCHDHKFDPIPTRDYYALAGILTSTKVMEDRYMLGQQRKMEQLIGIGPNGAELDDAYEAYWRERPRVDERLNRAKSALQLLNDGNETELQNLRREHEAEVAAAAANAEVTREARQAAQEALIAELQQIVSHPPEIPPRAMVARDAEQPKDEHVRLGGEFGSPDELVPRGVLQVLGDSGFEVPEGHSGRLELAHWLTDVEHGAGRLTARVLANRVWLHLMGRGIVRSADNFGRTGDLPSHPELLDHMAERLIQSGWSIRSLVRDVVVSRTNRMSSRHDPDAHAVDPENRLLWKFHRRRVTPETLRDAMLQAAGQLDPSPLDSTVWYLDDQATGVGKHPRRRTDFPNRSVYLPVIRNDLPELFDVFDFADPQMATGRRPETTVATQGLFLLNAELVMDAAVATARRLMSAASQDNDRLTLMFELILNDVPDDRERIELLTYVHGLRERLIQGDCEDPELTAWSMACHALFASSRFQMLE